MKIEVELFKKGGKYYGYLASTDYSCSGWETDGYDTKEECIEELKGFLLEEFYTGEEEDLIEEEEETIPNTVSLYDLVMQNKFNK